MKKTLSIVLLIALLISIVPIALISSVHATHTALVYWVDDGIGVKIDDSTKAFSSVVSSFNATFAVNNTSTGGDTIFKVRVVIPRNLSTGDVLFHFAAGYVLDASGTQPIPGWHADPTEFDLKGWPGTVIFDGFYSSGVQAGGDIVWFRLNFTEGPSS
jgi:hypothetical protein